jgi:hypothetical protein
VRIAIDLPCHLDALVASLPRDHGYTVNEFIDGHTMLPLFAPFMPSERLRQLRRDMRGAGGMVIHGRIGLLTFNIRNDYLRFCPICVEADRLCTADNSKEFGESFWRRLHQVPGVEVCPVHNVFLENSDVHIRLRRKREEFVTAEESAHTEPKRFVDFTNRLHLSLLRIAEDATWLLRQHGLESNPLTNRERYAELLIDRGFSTPFGKTKIGALTEAVSDHYTPELLDRLGCSLDRKHNWLRRLLHNKVHAQHPLPNLLLMQFLGCPPADFFKPRGKKPPSRPPFGEGPWPCLNRASDHFGQSIIRSYELTTTHDRRPRGTFHCECGFVYYRIGPDRSEESRYQKSRFIALGEVWESVFRELYEKRECTRIEMAERLGVSLATLMKKIAQLREETSLGSGVTQTTQSMSQEEMSRLEKLHIQQLIEEKRRLLLAAREAEPDAGRSKLRERLQSIIQWLEKYDQKWLEMNLPPRLKPQGPPGHVDWLRRDKELEKAVRDEAKRMFSMPGRPVRVSVTALAKRVGKLAVISKTPEKLPLTVEALNEVAESREDYALRRVKWAADCYRKEGVCPNRWQLRSRAALSTNMEKHPLVKTLIGKVLEESEPFRQNIEKIRNFNVYEIKTEGVSIGESSQL